MDTMTRRERQDLSEIVRRRARVTKASLDTLAADRQAEVERQLSAIHRADEDQWKAITTEANRLIREADAQLAHICDERGIRKEFRPSLSLSWYGRGENASASRRTELRKLAYARIDADRKAGLQLIEAWTADKLTVLISGSLGSDEAKAFLDSLPSAEAMLPPVRLTAELDSGKVETPRRQPDGALRD